jgi:hypothetical protein
MVWFGHRAGTEQKPWARIPALAVSMFLVTFLGSHRVQGAVEPDSVEVLTYLGTQAPPGVGASVCLTGRAGAAGYVSSVRLLPGHESGHDLWEVVMELATREASKVSTDSVVYAMIRPEADPICPTFPGPFLEIHSATPSFHTPIKNRIVLKSEVTYFAEIGYMLPRPWARRAIDSITNFVAIDIGVIYIELLGGGVIFIVGVATLVVFARRKALLGRQN